MAKETISGTGEITLNRSLRIASKLFVWGLFALSLYVLRSFFLLIFLTFFFAFIQASGVDRLSRFIRNRPIRVVLVGVLLVSLLSLLGLFLFPQVQEQAERFVDRLPSYLMTVDSQLRRLVVDYPALAKVLPQIRHIEAIDQPVNAQWDPKFSPFAAMVQEALGQSQDDGHGGLLQALGTARNIGAGVIATASTFLLSLLFSFLIVLDLPRLMRGARSLRNTKVRFIYEEVSDQIYHFGLILGRAFEAQLFIALLNTALTAFGIYLLGIGTHIAFLSVIVFFCSFIPVAGVFISSVPICLLSLQDSGFKGFCLAALLITVTHMVEAYILNPRIYGHHLRMNPIIVLIILTIGGKLLGVWGLILGVPLITYIFGYAIKLPEK